MYVCMYMYITYSYVCIYLYVLFITLLGNNIRVFVKIPWNLIIYFPVDDIWIVSILNKSSTEFLFCALFVAHIFIFFDKYLEKESVGHMERECLTL